MHERRLHVLVYFYLLINQPTEIKQTIHLNRVIIILKNNITNTSLFFVMMHVLITSKDLVEFREQIKVNIVFKILVVYIV